MLLPSSTRCRSGRCLPAPARGAACRRSSTGTPCSVPACRRGCRRCRSSRCPSSVHLHAVARQARRLEQDLHLRRPGLVGVLRRGRGRALRARRRMRCWAWASSSSCEPTIIVPPAVSAAAFRKSLRFMCPLFLMRRGAPPPRPIPRGLRLLGDVCGDDLLSAACVADIRIPNP